MNGSIKKNKSTKEHREYWKFIENTAAEVDKWPCWLKGGEEYCYSGERCAHRKKHGPPAWKTRTP